MSWQSHFGNAAFRKQTLDFGMEIAKYNKNYHILHRMSFCARRNTNCDIIFQFDYFSSCKLMAFNGDNRLGLMRQVGHYDGTMVVQN